MSLKERYVLCAYGKRAFSNRFIFERSAQRAADEANGIVGKTAYFVHPEAEFDANGRCPHARSASQSLHGRAMPDLMAAAADSPRLWALLDEIQRGDDRYQGR